MLQAFIAILTSLPTILKLVEKLIALYEEGVKTNEKKLLEKADDDVTKFITRVRASSGVREDGVSGKQTINEPPGNNQCNCSGSEVCERCLENGK